MFIAHYNPSMGAKYRLGYGDFISAYFAGIGKIGGEKTTDKQRAARSHNMRIARAVAHANARKRRGIK